MNTLVLFSINKKKYENDIINMDVKISEFKDKILSWQSANNDKLKNIIIASNLLLKIYEEFKKQIEKKIHEKRDSYPVLWFKEINYFIESSEEVVKDFEHLKNEKESKKIYE